MTVSKTVWFAIYNLVSKSEHFVSTMWSCYAFYDGRNVKTKLLSVQNANFSMTSLVSENFSW